MNSTKLLQRKQEVGDDFKGLRAEPPHVSEPRISQGHMMKGSWDITGRDPSREVMILPICLP